MTSKIKAFFVAIFAVFLLCVSTQACTCVRDNLKAKGFHGEVFDIFGLETPRKEPIKSATVRLLKLTEVGNRVVAEIVTDENGRFAVENIKAGSYILEVRAKHFETIATKIKIQRSYSRKIDQLLINLQPASQECCPGYAKVQKS